MDITKKIIGFLNENNVKFIVKEHAPTLTSVDSARERGEPMKIGAKALLVKDDTHFVLVVVPADRKLDTKKLKKVLNTRNLRFATREELFDLTGLVPGCVPPFGALMSLEMLVDCALFEEEFMAFNAGSLTLSVKMKTSDYKKIVNPKVEEISDESSSC